MHNGDETTLLTWSTTNSFRSNRRLPARVATGMVILMVTPSTGKKPKFCSCECREDRDVLGVLVSLGTGISRVAVAHSTSGTVLKGFSAGLTSLFLP